MGNVRVPADTGWVNGEDGSGYHGFPFQSSWTGKKGMLRKFMFPVGNGFFKGRNYAFNAEENQEPGIRTREAAGWMGVRLGAALRALQGCCPIS